MADHRNRVARASRLVRLQKLMLEADQSRLAILEREKNLLAEHAGMLLRQMSDHAGGNMGGTSLVADMLGHLSHRDAIVSNLTDLQAGIVRQARASLQVAEQRGELARRGCETDRAEQAMEDSVQRMVQSASLPKG